MIIARFVRHMVTLLVGVCVPLIVLFALLLAGEPPAIMAVWERGEVRVVAHETVIRDTGYGHVERIEVRASGPDGETRRLQIADDPSGAGAARLFPVGSVVEARLSPGGALAWPDGETGPFSMIARLAAPLILLVVLSLALRPLMSLLAFVFEPLRPMQAALQAVLWQAIALMSFVTIPLFVMGVFWSFGDTPAQRWFAPVVEAQILETRIQPGPRDHTWTAHVVLAAPGLAFPELAHGSSPFREETAAEDFLTRFTPGEAITVRLYRRQAHLRKLYPFDVAVIAASLICLLVILTGVLAIVRSLIRPTR